MAATLQSLMRQYQIEKELCDSAPTLDALMYWWGKWTRTAFEIYRVISRMGLVGACHTNPDYIGNPADD